MSCEKWREHLIDHLAGELGEEETILLEQHLTECTDCSEEELRLRRVMVAALPTQTWQENKATEEYLVNALHDLDGDNSEEMEFSSSSERSGLADRIARSLGFESFSLGLKRPVPSYLALGLAIVAVAAGFWWGTSNRIDLQGNRSAQPAREIQQEESLSNDGASGLAERHAVGEDSSAASLKSWPSGAGIRFATTPSDAISLARAFMSDTL